MVYLFSPQVQVDLEQALIPSVVLAYAGLNIFDIYLYCRSADIQHNNRVTRSSIATNPPAMLH